MEQNKVEEQIKITTTTYQTKNERKNKQTNQQTNEPSHIVSNYKNCLIDLFVYISRYRRWNMMESVTMPK